PNVPIRPCDAAALSPDIDHRRRVRLSVAGPAARLRPVAQARASTPLAAYIELRWCFERRRFVDRGELVRVAVFRGGASAPRHKVVIRRFDRRTFPASVAVRLRAIRLVTESRVTGDRGQRDENALQAGGPCRGPRAGPVRSEHDENCPENVDSRLRGE